MKSAPARLSALMTMVVAVACGTLTIMWPDWRAALQAQTYYRAGMRMTGGGSVVAGGRESHSFQLQCDVNQGPNGLEVNWGKGNKFHLEGLTRATCSDDPAIEPNPPEAGFDTYEGAGTGRYNGVAGATAEWTFTDAGKPGSKDSAEIVIMDSTGSILAVSGMLTKGNHQAHGH